MLLATRLILISVLVTCILCRMSLSHINLKTTLELSEHGDKMITYDANQKGEIIAVAMQKSLLVYKLVSRDYYKLIGQIQMKGIIKISVGDVMLNGDKPWSEEIVLLMIGFQDKLKLYKISVQKQKILPVRSIQTGPILNILSNKHSLPYLTIQTANELEFYHIDKLNKELSYSYKSGSSSAKFANCILMSNRAKNQILLVMEGRIVRVKLDKQSKLLTVSEDEGQKKGNIVEVSISKEGKEMYVSSNGLLKALYLKWTGKIAQYNKKDPESAVEDNILLEIDKKIKGITIDKLGVYLAYLEEKSLNLGRLSNSQIEHINSYDLSQLCQPFSSPFTHIQYVYEERLVIPCTQGATTKLLIVHTCQAQGCTDFCGYMCGDCIVDPGQTCDDCNGVSNDGCSSLCLIEPKLQIKIVYIQKQDSSNFIEIKFQIVTDANVTDWVALTTNGYLNVTGPAGLLSPIVVTNENNTGYFFATFAYYGDIHKKDFNIAVDYNMFGYFPTTLPLKLTTSIVPTDNEGAFLYDDSIYQVAGTIRIMSIFGFVLAILFFFLGLLAGKIIGIEMMAVIQVSYLSLMQLTTLNPSFNYLSQLFFVNGYNNNLGFNKQYLSQNELTKIKGLSLLPHFLQNYNLTMVLVFVPFVLGIIVLIVSIVTMRNWQKYWKRLMGEYTFNGLMFSGYIVAVSLALQFKYGMNDRTGIIGGGSILFSVVFILLYLLYFILLILKPEVFGQFTNFFHQDRADYRFYLLPIMERFIVGIILVFMLTFQYSYASFIAVMVFYVAIILNVFARKPFVKPQHNFRFILNMLIASGIQAIYLVYNMETAENQNKKDLYTKFLPLLVVIALCVCVLYSGVAIIWQIIRWCRGQTQKDALDYQHDQLNQTKENEQVKNDGGQPPQIEQTKQDIMVIESQMALDDIASKRLIQPQVAEVDNYARVSQVKKQLAEDFGINNNRQQKPQPQVYQQQIVQEEIIPNIQYQVPI